LRDAARGLSTSAKLAWLLKQRGKTVLVAAADTFLLPQTISEVLGSVF